MPLQHGPSRRTVSKNIRTERRAGTPGKQAIAEALAEQRKSLPRRVIAHTLGHRGAWSVELVEVTGQRWYEAIWRKYGLKRAHRHVEGSSLPKVREQYKAFVDEALHWDADR
jgi:hypothetical protein